MRPLALALLLLLPIPAAADELRGVVVAVHDGDTLTIRSGEEIHKIRLSAIDAPELSQDAGKLSRDWLWRKLEGKEVAVIWSKRDRNDRIVGIVLCGSENLNLLQLQLGLAWFDRSYARELPRIEQLQFEAAEREARDGPRGLWLAGNPVPPWEFRRRRRAGE